MIIRFKKDSDNPYVMVYKGMPEDELLSLKAKGLLLYILTKPDDWQIYIKQLASKLKESTNTIARIIRELRIQGYCHRTQIREVRGVLTGYEYNIYEKRREKDPELTKEEQKAENSPKRQNDDTVIAPKRHNPDTVNDVLLNTELTNNKKKEEDLRGHTSASISMHDGAYTRGSETTPSNKEPAQLSSSVNTEKEKEPEKKVVTPVEEYSQFISNLSPMVITPVNNNSYVYDIYAALKEADLLNTEYYQYVSTQRERETGAVLSSLKSGECVESWKESKNIPTEKPSEKLYCPSCATERINKFTGCKCKLIDEDTGWTKAEDFHELSKTEGSVERMLRQYPLSEYWQKIAATKYPNMYEELKDFIDAEEAEDMRERNEAIEEMHRKFPELYAGRSRKEAVKV